MNPYPQKKVITFNKHTDDFGFHVNYAELDHIPSNELAYIGNVNLSQVLLTGVGEALAKHTGENIEYKGIKTHFNIDDSGLLNLVHVEYVAEKTVTEEDDNKDSTLSKIGSTISKLFGSDAETPEMVEEKPEEKPQEGEAKNDTKKVNETETDKQNATEPDVKPKPKVIVLKEPVKSEEQHLNLQPLSPEDFQTSKAKIAVLNSVDNKRIQRETALNNLEAFVVDTQMKLDTKEYAECGTQEELDNIRKFCSETSEWLYEDGYEATTDLFEAKLATLKDLTNPIFFKYWEHKERPESIALLSNMLDKSKDFLQVMRNLTKETNPDKDVFTEVEINLLEKQVDETTSWLTTSMKEQNALKKNEEVKLTVQIIRDKYAMLEREVKYMLNKMKIWKPKKTVKKEAENKTEESIVEPETVDKDVKPENTQEEKPATEKGEKVESTEPPLQLSDGQDEHSEL